MTERYPPRIVTELILVHAVVTRGLTVGIASAEAFEREGFLDPTLRDGYLDYVRCLVTVLHGHHLLEDDLAFPYFRRKLPGTPFELLASQHRELARLLVETSEAIDEVAAAAAAPPLGKLREMLGRVSDVWHPHMRIEERHFTAVTIGSVIDLEEQERLSRTFREHGSAHNGPEDLVVPFLLFNLPKDKRAMLAAGLPPTVTERLVPEVWRSRWARMAPFLLQ